jgi:mannitol-1-phosphate 5-dehydrogenase
VKKKLIQYGAGNIGRSLAGQLFSSAGWEVVFVDVALDVIEALNRERRYRVAEVVAREIATCDLLSTAVGSKVLPHISATIAKGLELRRDPLDIVLCENLRGAPDLMRSYLEKHLPAGFPFKEKVGLIATSIGKMVPIMPPEVRLVDPLEVWAEAYNQIVADREGFIGEIPQVNGLVVRGCFEAYVDQKLFVHNLGHAVSAYLGDRIGAVTIAEAMERGDIASATQKAMEESGKALVSIYPSELKTEDMDSYIGDLIHRFKNPSLGDTVYRVGRDRMRKYAADDRLVGSLKAHKKAGIESAHTLRGIAAGLHFSATDSNGERLESDVEFERIFEQEGSAGILTQVCGLDPKVHAEWFRGVADSI